MENLWQYPHSLRWRNAHGEGIGVDRRKLLRARHLFDPCLKDDRRTMPKEDLPGCDSCPYATGEVCCKQRKVVT